MMHVLVVSLLISVTLSDSRNLNRVSSRKCFNLFQKWTSRKNISRLPMCRRPSSQYGNINTRESDHPSVFRDLTQTEIKGLLDFLYAESSLNLTVAEKASVTSNYIFIADIYRPLKRDILNHLDNGHPQPEREAHVMIFRGAIPKPDVIEIVVGPLPNPSAYKHVPYRPKSLPFIDRPFNVADYVGKVLNFLDKTLGDMLLDLHISYGFWEFDIANAAFRGPRLNDIRYKNERIAYEVSTQELAVFYFGYKPFEYTSFYLDNSYQTGTLAKYLVPGVDCPLDATFLSSSYKVETQDKPLFNEHSFCVFEFNTGIPLRRQHGYFKNIHSFYEGVENIVLIVRTIPTVYPYEYIIDFIFYHNGVMKIKVTASGVVVSTWYGQDNPFSFQLDDNLMAPLHQHLYHFKVDFDIKGTKNRFETLDIESVVTPNEASDVPNATIVQNQFMKRLKKTEFEGAYKFDFNFPKYLTFVNNNVKDKFGNSAGYRLVNEGMIKNTRPPNDGNNPAASWSQYQVAVTKYKDSEPTSSNMFAHSNNPVFNFQEFIDDNESIVDQDLVAWVSMGMYHIPKKEDFPSTHTPGMSRSFYLIPFNYFDESPGMSVNNAVRIDAVEKDGKTETVKIRRYGVRSDVDCIPKKNPFEKMLKENPCSIVEC
ncbi:AOC1 [Mytilus coruscus]|uniref:Amine oxidase n=1 Tax=Mytilus coruscus TaxID=42192 RepID=A0A6J8DY52_MYTCO|nr:AOC1 [Mytilus coruscus]